jgi:hypothetical protein
VAISQRKSEQFDIPRKERGDVRRDARNANVVTGRFDPAQALAQFHFRTPADPAAEYRRAIAVVGLVAVGAVGAITAIAYFAGIIAAGIVAAAVGALVGFGNWVLNNTIDLR